MPEPSSSDPAPALHGLARLYGQRAVEHFQRAHVMVIGLGGVGSWTVEALARSGIGKLTLVDLDDVCPSNINRQLPALHSTVGQLKAEILAARCRDINPACEVMAETRFYTEKTSDHLLGTRPDYVLDAIDNLRNKCLLLARCREADLPVATSAGAGGRLDPTRLRCGDLAQSTHDPLAAAVRKTLRREYGFPVEPGTPFGIPCVFSDEPLRLPEAPDGCPSAPSGRRLNCDGGLGTTTAVTGCFGFHLAAIALKHLA